MNWIDEALLLYNPDQPRDAGGKWTSGGWTETGSSKDTGKFLKRLKMGEEFTVKLPGGKTQDYRMWYVKKNGYEVRVKTKDASGKQKFETLNLHNISITHVSVKPGTALEKTTKAAPKTAPTKITTATPEDTTGGWHGLDILHGVSQGQEVTLKMKDGSVRTGKLWYVKKDGDLRVKFPGKGFETIPRTSVDKAKVAGTMVTAAPKMTVNALKFDKELGGSTGAKLYKDADGNKFVVKHGANAAHLENEFKMEQAYRTLGVNVPESKMMMVDGKMAKVSKFVEGKSLKEHGLTASVKAQLQDHFVADALLGNWDVVGQTMDNVIVDKEGKAWHIDVGGAGKYRAMGTPKSASQWKSTVDEMHTMLDSGKNYNAAMVFSGIKPEDIKKQVQDISKHKSALAKIDPMIGHRIDDLVATYASAPPKPGEKYTSHEKWKSSLSASQRGAIASWKGHSGGIRKTQWDPEYAKINPSEVEKAALIEKAVATGPPTGESQLYRGLSGISDKKLEMLKNPGATIEKSCLTGFSKNLSTAHNFSYVLSKDQVEKYKAKGKGTNAVVFVMSKNKTAVSMAGIGGFSGEAECIAPKGATYKVTKYEFKGGRHYAYIEEIEPQGGARKW